MPPVLAALPASIPSPEVNKHIATQVYLSTVGGTI